ncbi:MAG: hypothetical protein EA362_13315 [Saprospirales bacterium]|nr:MAG: hypothetical protein EA362_13315 [Saprospirales bacterium]
MKPCFPPTSIFSEKWLSEYLNSPNRKERIELMTAGSEELYNWLLDLFGQGITQLQNSSRFEIESIAKRMVDCKNGSLARRLRIIATDVEKPDWDEVKTIEDLLELYFLCRAFKKVDKLPLLLKAELLQIAGMSWRKKDLEGVVKVSDQWICLHVEEDWIENLRTNTVYLVGIEKKVLAKVHLYAFRFEPFSHSFRTAQVWRGELVFFPSTVPLNAFVGDDFQVANSQNIPDLSLFRDIQYSVDHYRGLNPLRWEWPVLLPSTALSNTLLNRLRITDKNGNDLTEMTEFAALDNSLIAFGTQDFSKFKLKSWIQRGRVWDVASP